MKKMKEKIFALLSIVVIFLITSCGGSNNSSELNKEDLIGKTFSLDTYHQIEFKSATTYWIYQRPLNCGGNGSWSIKNNEVVLGPNDSSCESTRKMKGNYRAEKFN
jgi:hypothetical protein